MLSAGGQLGMREDTNPSQQFSQRFKDPATRKESEMAKQTMTVYDLATGEVREVPAGEPPPGTVPCTLTKIGPGEAAPGPIRHPPFSPEVRALIRDFPDIFRDVCPRTLEQWEDGFRRDLHPGREIAIWLLMANVFEHFTAGLGLRPETQMSILRVVLAYVNHGCRKEALPDTAGLGLPRWKVEEIVEYMEELKGAGGLIRPQGREGAPGG
jgi:hypothetical protein